MKKILMVALQYPPFCDSAAVQRALAFSKYLPENGWEPIVLTVNPGAYDKTSQDLTGEVPKNIIIRRTPALNISKHIAIKGRYPGWLALPDKWNSWWFSGVICGLGLIRKYRPEAIFSTCPPTTPHLIGLTLKTITKVPWVADFRDPMTQEDYPYDFFLKWLHERLERPIVKSCDRAVFPTDGAMSYYMNKYPNLGSSRWVKVENGYDEDIFIKTEKSVHRDTVSGDRVLLVYSGAIAMAERNPIAFFDALSELKRKGAISQKILKVVLRSETNKALYKNYIGHNSIEDIVSMEPSLPYRSALEEMIKADGLLIFQSSNCNRQIPAKAYEYIRARRPIFAMTDPEGDTARLLKDNGIDTVVPLDSKEKIMAGLIDFIKKVRQGTAPVPNIEKIRKYSRQAETAQLARILNDVSAGKPGMKP